MIYVNLLFILTSAMFLRASIQKGDSIGTAIHAVALTFNLIAVGVRL